MEPSNFMLGSSLCASEFSRVVFPLPISDECWKKIFGYHFLPLLIAIALKSGSLKCSVPGFNSKLTFSNITLSFFREGSPNNGIELKRDFVRETCTPETFTSTGSTDIR